MWYGLCWVIFFNLYILGIINFNKFVDFNKFNLDELDINILLNFVWIFLIEIFFIKFVFLWIFCLVFLVILKLSCVENLIVLSILSVFFLNLFIGFLI